MINNSFSWDYMGTMDSPFPIGGGGVYLLVFRGSPKRVIYVGETQSFAKRIEKHRQDTLNGNKAIWKVDSTQDIYELMSCNGERQRFEYYASLAKKKLLWATTTLEKGEVSNDLLKRDDFGKNWSEFARNSYVKNIEVWVCETPDDKTLRKSMESQIQSTLRINYSIESHIHNGKDNMCWLGKIEFGNEVFNYQYNYINSPDISDEFTQLLNNLNDKNVIKYLKPSIAQKKATAKVKLDVARETYKNTGKSWKLLDEIEFKKLINANTPLLDIAARLSRAPEELEKRHQYLLNNNVQLPKLCKE